MTKRTAPAAVGKTRQRRRSGAPDVWPSPKTPRDFEELMRTLQRGLPLMSPSHTRIARQVLGDPEGCAFMTITELASVVGVNESTVARFASRLGLSGYPALTALCRKHLKEQAQLIGRFERLLELTRGDGTGDGPTQPRRKDRLSATLESQALSDERNILRTFARIDRREWQHAVRTCAQSRTVYVVGLRKCYAIAHLLSYLLGLIRDDIRHVTSDAGTLADRLRQVGAGDTFIAISIHRYTRDTVRAIKFARDRGAFTIAFTDNAASPLSSLADIAFYVDTSSVSVLRSVSAFISLVQAFVGAVAVESGTRARSALLLEEDVLSEFDVYFADGAAGTGTALEGPS